MLTIRITKLSNERHRFEYRRDDGTGESSDLETRSFLNHDLVHFAVETEARLTESFYGLLDAGHTYAELNAKDAMKGGTVVRDELGTTEWIVGPITSVIVQRSEPAGFLRMFRSLGESQGLDVPAFLDEDFVRRVQERFRRLQGRWKATPFGKTMELRFPDW